MKNIFLILLAIMFATSTAQAGLTSTTQTIYGDKTFEHSATFKKDVTIDGALLGVSQYSTVFYVSSATGSDVPHYGKTYSKPFATVDYAINRTTANRGDIIYVLPGHAESYSAADGFDADVAGISIIGLGNGQDMPEFTFADTDATVAIGAQGVMLKNLRLLGGISEVVTGVSVEAAGDDAVIDGLYFPEPTTSTFEFDKSILLATGADRVTIKNCIAFSADATGATNFIDLDTGVQNGTRIINNWIYGEYAEGAIHSDDIDLDITVWGNTVHNLTSGQHCIEFTAAALGVMGENYCYTDAEATSYDPGSLKAVAPNWVVTAIDASPVMFPAADDTAQNFIGVDDNNNAAATSNVAANEDGTILERLEQIQEAVNNGTGTALSSNKSVVDLFNEQTPRVATKATGDLTAFGTSMTLFNVTGDVLAKCAASVDVAVTSTSGTTTLEVGVAGNTAAFLVQDAVDGTAFDVGDSWTLITAADANAGQVADEWTVVGNGVDIILTGSVDDITAGDIDVYCQYVPLSSDGAVAAAP